ncbi:hypothetical protein EZS27_015917 [termite gut metagenome]|uniref:Uncharacterized protein n=1 Tax=termite gut metagenome TaxID=433724 RepID=A0A5J4RS10_9ZZZZ
MKIKFIKPAPGYAYFKGDIAVFFEAKASELIKAGFCEKLDREEEKEESDLPVSLPGRAILIKEGFHTIAKVLAAEQTLTDIKGITKPMAESIIAALKPKE